MPVRGHVQDSGALGAAGGLPPAQPISCGAPAVASFRLTPRRGLSPRPQLMEPYLKADPIESRASGKHRPGVPED